jgi:hypothetical protein
MPFSFEFAHDNGTRMMIMVGLPNHSGLPYMAGYASDGPSNRQSVTPFLKVPLLARILFLPLSRICSGFDALDVQVMRPCPRRKWELGCGEARASPAPTGGACA